MHTYTHVHTHIHNIINYVNGARLPFCTSQLCICVQINGPQEEVEAAAAMLDKWQPLDAYGN